MDKAREAVKFDFFAKYSPYKLLVVSLISAVFFIYPNISIFSMEREYLGEEKQTVHLLYFIFRYLYFSAFIWILLRHNILKIKTNSVTKRWGHSFLITFAVYLAYVGFSLTLSPKHEWLSTIMLFQFLIMFIYCTLLGQVIHLYSDQRQKEQEIEHLKLENLQSRYDALTQQINPHFFFNSHNGLTSLIRKKNEETTLAYVSKLSDGSAFSIFEKIKLETPVIFTTAYDEYAIEAFKVNSIDYLLKPIKTDDVRRALDKFKKLNRQDILKYLSQLSLLTPGLGYRDKLLIPVKDKLQPVDLAEISFFYTTDRNTRIYLKNRQVLPYSKTLEQIEQSLNPRDFMRANKQFIVSRSSVKNITIWFESRLLVTPDVEPPERIYISKNKAAEFKAWIVNDI